MRKVLRKKATYIDGDKDVHLPLTNCTAFLCKKRKYSLSSTTWLYYYVCCLSYRSGPGIDSISRGATLSAYICM